MRQRDADRTLPRPKALFVRRTTPRPAGTEGPSGSERRDQHAQSYSAIGVVYSIFPEKARPPLISAVRKVKFDIEKGRFS